MTQQKLYFNGFDLDCPVGQDSYRRSPCLLEDLVSHEADPGDISKQHKGLVAGVDPNALDQAGWGLISHESLDPMVLEALEPLINKRRSESGPLFKHLMFQSGDTIDSFRKRLKIHRGDADPKRLPYYLLIVGEPSQIPFAFQTELDVSYAVGRLCFDTIEDYAGYAERVLAYEAIAKPQHQHRLLFFSPHNDDQATVTSNDQFIKPLAENLGCDTSDAEHLWQIDHLGYKEASRMALVEALSANRPDILFTAAHGATFMNTKEYRQPYQGSILCSDWPSTTLPPMDTVFKADDLHPDMDLSGMFAFLFGCYSGGTPHTDLTRSPNTIGKRLHDKSFVANLPKQMLAHRQGGLAVIGHVDECFEFSFLWNEDISELGHFRSMLKRLMMGERIGHAMEHFATRLADLVLSQMARIYDPDPPTPEEIETFWLVYQDARNYVLLGDPATRLQ